jgi:uncharacterized membrane protein YphA (DoxX/SURF4 family)
MKIDKIINKPFIEFLSRLILGSIFIYASLDKIIHPGLFADSLFRFQILPIFAIKPMAILLPFLEFICGSFLIIGLYKKTSVFILSNLLIVFIFAIAFSLIRGININCGCFSQTSEANNLVVSLIKNIFFLFLAIPVFKKN